MAIGSLIHHARLSKPALLPYPYHEQQIRRIFNSDQIIERFDKWLLICGKAAHTRENYVFSAKQFARFLVDKPLTAMTKDDVRAFLGTLYAGGMAATTIQARLHALRALGDCLRLAGQVQTSIPRFILSRKLPKRLPHVKTEEEIKQLIAAACSPRDLAILELAYASGLRVSEIANLRIEDVNLKAGSLTVRHGKGDKDRIALFGGPAAVALRTYIGERKGGRIFLQQMHRQRGGIWRGRYGVWFGQWREIDDNGKSVMRTVRLGDYEIQNRKQARLALDSYLKNKLPEKASDMRPLGKRGIYNVIAQTALRAGIGHVNPHMLRHCFATHCLNHGMDIRYVQEFLGHSNISTTTKYLHLAISNLKQVHENFFPGG